MKTTLILQDAVLKEAMEVTGIKEKTAVVHLGLKELIQKAARERLIHLGGTYRKAKASKRRRLI